MKISKKTANAKINLGLQVLQKRIDGYHNINTVFAKINLSDFLEFIPAKITKIKIEPDFPIKIDDNLIYKAISIFNSYFQTNYHFDVKLIKNIPTGAGLGGGSSDAASTLLFLNEYSNFRVTDKELNDLALQLGSDVPFFLNTGIAKATGRGEILTYYDVLLPFKVLVINPRIHISTPLAYKALNRSNLEGESINFIEILNKSITDTLSLNLLVNDFEEFAFKEYPVIAEIKKKLYESGAVFALMSGSGSSIFGLFNDEKEAQIAKEKFSNYFTFLADFVL